jgi:soluble P-type ATPase
MKSIDN